VLLVKVVGRIHSSNYFIARFVIKSVLSADGFSIAMLFEPPPHGATVTPYRAGNVAGCSSLAGSLVGHGRDMACHESRPNAEIVVTASGVNQTEFIAMKVGHFLDILVLIARHFVIGWLLVAPPLANAFE